MVFMVFATRKYGFRVVLGDSEAELFVLNKFLPPKGFKSVQNRFP